MTNLLFTLLIGCVLVALSRQSGDHKSMYTCTKNEHGEEYCSKADSPSATESADDDDDDEPVFFEDQKEKLTIWDPVHKGFERKIRVSDDQEITMRTAAVQPRVFVIPDFLTDLECEHIKSKAMSAGLFDSELHIDKHTAESKQYTHGHAKTIFGDFTSYDEDFDGKITRDEFKKLAKKSSLKIYLSDKDLDAMLEKLKITSFEDGVITAAEFKTMNTQGISEYLSHKRETDPKFRDRFSEQAWLRQDSDSSDTIMVGLKEKVIKLTQLPRYIVDGMEPLQVVHYHPGGHYHAHFDGQDNTVNGHDKMECCHFDATSHPVKCMLCRYITILYFLNQPEAGGETAFPVADQKNYDHEEFRTRKKDDLYNLSEFCHNASLVVPPKKGTAIMWYNHHMTDDGWMGNMDYYSLHGGCDILKGEKWIANNWLTAPFPHNSHKVSLYAMTEDDLNQIGLSTIQGAVH